MVTVAVGVVGFHSLPTMDVVRRVVVRDRPSGSNGTIGKRSLDPVGSGSDVTGPPPTHPSSGPHVSLDGRDFESWAGEFTLSPEPEGGPRRFPEFQ